MCRFFAGKVLEFVWGGARICVGKVVGCVNFLWGRWSIFVGEGGRICVAKVVVWVEFLWGKMVNLCGRVG
jgi:hypothetical protein